jgi:hypothetical protein
MKDGYYTNLLNHCSSMHVCIIFAAPVFPISSSAVIFILPLVPLFLWRVWLGSLKFILEHDLFGVWRYICLVFCYLPLFGVLIECFLVFGALSCIWSWKVVTTLVEVVNL